MTIRTDETRINWRAKGTARVAQNVRNLMQTYRYEIAYERTLGLPPELIDRPGPDAAALLKVELAQLIARYEPRAKLSGISCRLTTDGQLEMEVELDD